MAVLFRHIFQAPLVLPSTSRPLFLCSSSASSSMEPHPSKFMEFPYVSTSHKNLMVNLVSTVETRLASHLLPSSLPPDVQYYQNDSSTNHAALHIRSALPSSPVDFILGSWLHCQLPTGGALNITSFSSYLNSSTDAPNFLLELIQSSPASLVLILDLPPRKDLVLHPDYLKTFYEDTKLDIPRQSLEKLAEVKPYYSSSLYIRSVVSPTAILVRVDAEEGGLSLEEIIEKHVGPVAEQVLGIWLEECACGKREVGENERAELKKRDDMVKRKTIEIDLGSNFPRLFGPEAADRVLGAIREAYRLRGLVELKLQLLSTNQDLRIGYSVIVLLVVKGWFNFLEAETMTSGGLRTSVKGYLIAQRVTVAPEINTVHDNEMNIYAISNSIGAEFGDHPPDPLSVPDTSASHGNNPCLPILTSAAKGMASYGARTKSESPPHIENEILQSFHLRSFQFNELKVATANFCPEGILAQGGLGSVYKGWIDAHSLRAAKPGNGIAVVIKRLSQQRTLQRQKDWLTEVSFLGQLDHPNLVKLIGYCLEDGIKFLVHEFIPQESLNVHLYDRASRGNRLSWNRRMKISLGAADGLAFLHNEAKVIYGDFKTSKILLESDYNAKLYGYGSAIERLHGYRSHFSEADVAMYEDGLFHLAAAPSVYAAPETCKGGYSFQDNSTPKSDVYSYGVVLLEVLSGRRAFDNSKPPNEKNLVQFAKNISSRGDSAKRKVAQIFDPHIDGQYFQGKALKALNLAIQCVSMEPESRPNMNEVVEVLEQLQPPKSSCRQILCQF